MADLQHRVDTGDDRIANHMKAEGFAMDESDAIPAELRDLRAGIDNLDASLIFILSERFKLTRRVGQLKAEHRLPASDPAREQFQMARLQRLADEAQLDPVFAARFLRFVIDEVVHHHVAASEQVASPVD